MAKGRSFTSLSAEDQQILANGLNTANSGGWKYQWETNDIDNEFSTMDKRTQDFLLTQMDQARAKIKKAQLQYDNNKKINDAAWAPYGGAPAGALGSKVPGLNQTIGQPEATSGYVPKTDGSDAWKFSGYLSPAGMKNPVYIGNKYYDMPVSKPQAPASNPYQNQAPNLSGGQALVPTVAQRMSRMGQAVQKGVNKGSMKASQLDRYRQQPSAPVSPLVNQLQGSQGYYNPASNPQQTGNTYNQGYPTAQLANYSAPKPVPLPQGKSRGS